jgi:epoxyqueuosine reductase
MLASVSSEADRLVRARVRELGFTRVGVARADEPVDLDHARYEGFLAAGYHGQMSYLGENREARRTLDGESIMRGARTVVCVAESYAAPPAELSTGELREDREPRVLEGIARYARGRDYHKHLRRRLRKLAAFIRRLGPGVRARPTTDTAPVLERAWASRAGLGFVGKNGMLIAPGLGSFVLLGEVVTTLELTPDVPIGERCGSCTACLQACPTDAFAAPFVLDARKCISYLTIELRGPVPEEHRAGIGEHLFGCDACQEVCPFNRGVNPARRALPAYAPLERWTRSSVEELTWIDDADWEKLKECSPIGRATKAGLERNAVTVLANLRNPRYRKLFERLAASHSDPAVREHAAWALALLEPAAKQDREAPP